MLGILKKMFKTALYLDTYKLISFKLGLMIGMTKLYILIPVGMSLEVTWLQES